MPAPRFVRRLEGARRRRRDAGPVPVRAVVAVVAVLLVLLVALLPSPYAIERPGPVYDTLGSAGTGADRAPLITISGVTTYPTRGRLDLLTVLVAGRPDGGPPWPELAAAWLDPTQAVVPLEAVFPRGTTSQEAQRQTTAQMTSSQQSATAAALLQLGYDVQPKITVAYVRPGTAAVGVLRKGDLITSFAGKPVEDSCGLQNDVLASGTARVPVVVERDGAQRTVQVAPRTVALTDGSTQPLLGIATTAAYRFPVEVDLRIDGVGGPSAGQMFALGVIDKLTPGALTGGRHVAGTGTICGDGTIGPIGGIVQKMAAARAAGATVFLAPDANCAAAVGHIPAGLDVAAVGTLSESLAVLEQVRRQGASARLPSCAAQVVSAP